MSRRKGPNPQNFPINLEEARRIRSLVIDAALGGGETEPREGLLTGTCRKMYQYPLLDETGMPTGQVWETPLTPEEVLARGDIHAETAKAIFGDTPPATPEEAKARRSAAQTAGFDALYGGGGGLKRLRNLAKT